MADKTMHHVVIGSDTYEIVDEQGRADIATLEADTTSLKEDINAFDVEVFGGAGEGFPLEFENGTYLYTATGRQLAKYYGGGYDLTRKVVKSTTFTPPCSVNIKAKTGYSFTVFLSSNGVISSNTGLITEYTMRPGQQYGMTLRTTGGTDDISGVPVSNIIDIDYVSTIDTLKAAVDDVTEAIENVSAGSLEYVAKQILVQNGAHTATNAHAILYKIDVQNVLSVKVTSARYASWSTAGPIIAFYSATNATECDATTLLLAGTRHTGTGDVFTEEYQVPEGAKSALVQSTDSYESSYGLPTVELHSISVQQDIEKIGSDVGTITEKAFIKTGSNNATLSIPYTVTPNVPVMFYWTTPGSPTNSLNIFTRNSPSGENIETLKTTAYPNTFYKVTPEQSASYLYLSATASGTIYIFNGGTIHGDIAEIQDKIATLSDRSIQQPFVKFSFSDIMYDPSAIFAEGGEMGDVSAWPNAGADALSKVHAAFDALCASGGAGYGYGERITGLYKENENDEAQFDILAPSYVTNGVTQGEIVTLDIGTDTDGNPVTYNYTYESSTDPYEVRLYRFHDTNSALHTATVDIPKKKLLLIGGTHGNEFCAPINLYVFAKHLCTDYNNPDMLKLRSAFDVYIIPYLNGFGCQYKWNNQGYVSTGSRSNGHMVDINRNCETNGWVGATGTAEQITSNFESKIANLGVNTFAGSSNGSEFESKLLKAIINWLNPDVVIDHHHNEGTNPFYTICYGNYASNLIYQSANDVAYAMLHNMGSYYGTNYNLYLSSSVSPATKAASNGYVTTMAYEQGVKMNATTEMSQSISYLNGVFDATTRQNTKFGSDVFKISEYSLLNVMLHLCQYAMEH